MDGAAARGQPSLPSPPAETASGTEDANYGSIREAFPYHLRYFERGDIIKLNSMCAARGDFTPREKEFLLYTRGRDLARWDINDLARWRDLETPLHHAVKGLNVEKCRCATVCEYCSFIIRFTLPGLGALWLSKRGKKYKCLCFHERAQLFGDAPPHLLSDLQK